MLFILLQVYKSLQCNYLLKNTNKNILHSRFAKLLFNVTLVTKLSKICHNYHIVKVVLYISIQTLRNKTFDGIDN